jgi:GTP-binding protein EngB required for normal cell division
VFVLIDNNHEPQQIDLDFIDQLGKWEIPFVLALPKLTKINRQQPRNVASFISALSGIGKSHNPIMLPRQLVKMDAIPYWII